MLNDAKQLHETKVTLGIACYVVNYLFEKYMYTCSLSFCKLLIIQKDLWYKCKVDS